MKNFSVYIVRSERKMDVANKPRILQTKKEKKFYSPRNSLP